MVESYEAYGRLLSHCSLVTVTVTVSGVWPFCDKWAERATIDLKIQFFLMEFEHLRLWNV